MAAPLRVTFNSWRAARSPGTNPNRIPVSTDIPSVNARTRASKCRSRKTSLEVVDTSFTSSTDAHRANMRPNAPPARARSTLSARSCCTIRKRLAPSAKRTAISRCLADPRASRRFATFAHAMSKTMPTTAIRIWSGWTESLRLLAPRLPSTSWIFESRYSRLRSADISATSASRI